MNTKALLVNLGKRIRRARNEKKVSIAKLAELAKMDKASLSRIETGKTNVSYLTLQRLCSALGIPCNKIIAG